MIRKCLASDAGLCYHCDTVCPSCGTKKFNINTECEHCLYCESQYPIKQKKKYEKPDIREAIVIVEERPTVILLKGASK